MDWHAESMRLARYALRGLPRRDPLDVPSVANAGLYGSWSHPKPGGVSGRTHLMTWVRGAASDLRRARNVQRRRVEALSLMRWPDGVEVPQGDPDEPARVRAAVASLPARQREVIRLRYWDDMGTREAGARLGVSRQTVLNDERAALGAMRPILG